MQTKQMESERLAAELKALEESRRLVAEEERRAAELRSNSRRAVEIAGSAADRQRAAEEEFKRAQALLADAQRQREEAERQAAVSRRPDLDDRLKVRWCSFAVPVHYRYFSTRLLYRAALKSSVEELICTTTSSAVSITSCNLRFNISS